ncbi:hypothetical protein [Parasitella parasitica]|uniref:Uncharacterized protein n=1 Tax=Parasitella parasitica TaxID=35722 RepID=A0A0B7NSP3_9FUNG|nr:hypothetical protein [Parasitella parasitica]
MLENFRNAIIIPVIGCRVKELGCPLGTAVGIKPPRYDQIVAHGVLQNNNDLATIQVTKVNVPTWIAPPFANLQAGIALQSYGQPPLQMKIPIKYLITVSSNPDVPAPVPSTPYEPIDTMESNSDNITINDISDAVIQQKMQEMFGEAVDEVDKAGFIRGYKQFATIPSAATGNVEKANIRVVKDIFHLMDMIKPCKKHSLYKSFTRKFSESLFTIDEDDKSKIIEAFAKAKAADHQFPHDWESKMKYYRGWLWKRVRRKVSPPHVFLPLLVSLFLSFGPLKCIKSGRSLFDRKSWEQAASVLKIVGTNSLEGGVHQNLIRKFGSFGAGPELANAMLTEYRLRHNIDVGSHIDLMKRFLQACDQLENDFMVQVNALHYLGSEEVFGICPLPDNEMDSLGIEKMQTSTELTTCTNDDSTVPKLEDTALLRIGTTSRSSSSRYIFVAKSQGTRYAVLSVHTLKEKLEFSRILEADFKSPNTTQAASKSTRQRFQAVLKIVRDEIVQQQQQQQNQHQHQEQQQLPIPRMAHSPSPVIRRQPLTASGVYRPRHP